MLYRTLSKLLDYPDQALLCALPELRERLGKDRSMELLERQALAVFLEYLESMSLTELQAAYVLTFDFTPEHALHLTHHLFGDDKNRGPALIDLTEFYKEYGLEMATPESAAQADQVDQAPPNELPDFLPLVLEFASQLDEEEARMFLNQWVKVLRQLGDNLTQADSAYAPLVRLVEHQAQLIKVAA